MPNPSATSDTVDIVVPNGGTTAAAYVAIGNPTELGLIVPTITSGTLVVKVALDASGTGAQGLVDGTGTAKLSYGAGTGNFAISSNEMGACLGYAFINVVCGASQGAERTFKLVRKLAGIDPTV